MSSPEITKQIDLTDALRDNIDNFDLYNKKKYIYNNNDYTIIKYNKQTLKTMEDNEDPSFYNLSKFRSLVIRDKKLLVFSPEKSINFNTFNNKYTNMDDCWIEDFVDGTMINVYYDNINDIWEIATRSTVGGNIVFFNDIQNYSYFNCDNENDKVALENNLTSFKNVTFRSMFLESCNACNFDLNSLNTKFCYSFVMQHPFNRIVTPIQIPIIYLVKVYEIDNVNFPIVNIKEINIPDLLNEPPYIFANTTVKYINKYPLQTTLEDINLHYNNKLAPFHCVGSIIYNKDGTRTKIRNINYEEVRKLRGNQPKLQYNYLSLKKENKIKEFLYYYPEHYLLFTKFKIIMYDYTDTLFKNYIECFIKKQKPLKEYPFQYKNHMYHIHQKYINELKSNNKIVDKKVVIDYVNNLHPAQQMFVINYKYNNTNEKNMEIEE